MNEVEVVTQLRTFMFNAHASSSHDACSTCSVSCHSASTTMRGDGRFAKARSTCHRMPQRSRVLPNTYVLSIYDLFEIEQVAIFRARPSLADSIVSSRGEPLTKVTSFRYRIDNSLMYANVHQRIRL